MRPLLALLSATLLSLFALELLPLPFVAIGVLWFLAFGWIAATAKREAVRLAAINLCGVSLLLGAAELYLGLTAVDHRQFEWQNVRVEGSGDHLRVDHEVLGYGPQPDSKWIATRRYRGELIYEAEYTIDARGLRVTPGATPRGDPDACILLFGGSFTFGDGLDDDETLPYFLNAMAAGSYEIYNFAYGGYGPHQALAALESGHVEGIARCRPTHALFLTMAGHIPRSAGLESWDPSGPRYRLDPSGEVVRAGRFDAGEGTGRAGALYSLFERFADNAGKSLLYTAVASSLADLRKYDDENTRLCVAIVERIGEVLRSRYGEGVEYHVIFFDRAWDGTPKEAGERFLAGLDAAGLPVHRVGDILPDYDETNAFEYRINRLDAHPNARANELLADYVMDRIIR